MHGSEKVHGVHQKYYLQFGNIIRSTEHPNSPAGWPRAACFVSKTAPKDFSFLIKGRHSIHLEIAGKWYFHTQSII
jgi:hypothetical protein